MKFLFLQIDRPKKKKIRNLLQLANVKKVKKRNLAIALILVLVLAISAGGLSGKIFKNERLGEMAESQEKQTVQEKETAQDKKAAREAEVVLSADLENRLATDFIKTLMSGSYVIRYKTTTVYEGKAYEAETTYAVSDGRIALISGDFATVVRDERVYVMNHTDRTIISYSVDHEKGSPQRIDINGIAYIGGGKEGSLAWEEYSTASSRLKLYFNGKELVKLVMKIGKENTAMDILSVEKTVPDSLFDVPVGYRVTNI